MTRPGPLYWICQLGGWGAYALVTFVLGRLSMPASPGRALAIGAALGVGGLLFSHALRALARRWGWADRPLGGLLWRMLAASVVLGILHSQLTGRLLYLAMPSAPPVPPVGQLVYALNLAIVFFAWQLLYFGVRLWRRSREAELERLRAAAVAQDAALRMLKAQLNPHFLFNALNSLRALIREDPDRASELVTQLSNLLRSSLGSATEAVPLERELELVRDYLAIEQVRLESRLRVALEVPEDCLGVRVPVMIVQGLVENAVKHGPARMPAGGQVAVRARREGEVMELSVENDRPPGPGAGEGTGTGLANARERLRLLFHGRASLELDLAQPEAVSARLRIPVTG